MGEAAEYCHPDSALLHSTLCFGQVFNPADYTNQNEDFCDQNSITYDKMKCWQRMFPENGGCAPTVSQQQCLMVRRLENQLKFTQLPFKPNERGFTSVPPYNINDSADNMTGGFPIFNRGLIQPISSIPTRAFGQ